MPKSNDAHRVANVDEDDGEETQDDTHAMTTNELKIEALEALRNTRASANGNIEKARLVRDIVARELVRSDKTHVCSRQSLFVRGGSTARQKRQQIADFSVSW